MGTEHTALPWSVHHKRFIYGGAAQLIATVADPDLPIGNEEQANAELIVNAVNSHDRLLEACKKLLEICEAEDAACGIYSALQTKAKAAIESAEPL